MITETLSQITKAEAEAQDAAAKALAAAEEARHKADAARERAELQREQANKDFLDVLTAEYSEARSAALTKQAEARRVFEKAVLGESGDDVYVAYRHLVAASLAAWAVEDAIASQRYLLGRATRESNPPTFNFSTDLASVLNHHALVVQQEVIEATRSRRAMFLGGKETA